MTASTRPGYGRASTVYGVHIVRALERTVSISLVDHRHIGFAVTHRLCRFIRRRREKWDGVADNSRQARGRRRYSIVPCVRRPPGQRP